MPLRSRLAPWIILATLGMAAIFVASALLPPITLIFVMMALLGVAFGIVAWRTPHGD